MGIPGEVLSIPLTPSPIGSFPYFWRILAFSPKNFGGKSVRHRFLWGERFFVPDVSLYVEDWRECVLAEAVLDLVS
jgi:hypothetical protein